MKTQGNHLNNLNREATSGKYNGRFIVFLLIWFAINLIQAIFTEVLSDEAYYGLFGKYLDWGYYDHPPMVAIMTRISSLLFNGNLGIRFMTLILQLGTIILIWETGGFNKNNKLHVTTFFIIAASISLFSVYGVLTTPDAPLLFFTALFFFSYKRFIGNEGWKNVLLLSLSMAGLIYSKYQAVLVIGFVILSNIRLLRNYKFWMAGMIALVFLSPHIYWQISHGFPSFQYHLIDRSEGFRWLYFLEYLPNQMAVFNPFTFGAIIYVMIKFRPTGILEKGYYFQIWGFLIFFWLMSFRGHVEPHWTIACSVPAIILLTGKCSGEPSLMRFTGRFIIPSLLLLLAVRIIVMTDIRFVRNIAFGGKEKKYMEIEKEAGDLPVIFTGAFQRPSLYTFFTGREAMAISSIYSRQTQFDLWQFEKKHHNKPVFICSNPLGNSQIYVSDTLGFGGFIADSLQTVNRMRITFSLMQEILHPGDSVKVSFYIHNPYESDIDFNHNRFPVEICMIFLKGKELIVSQIYPDEPIHIVGTGETVNRTFILSVPELPEGNYNFGLSLNTMFGPSLNSSFRKIKIIEDD